MSELVQISLDEITHLNFFKAVLTQLVIKSGGEITLRLNQDPKLFLISYNFEQSEDGTATNAKIKVEEVGNVH